MDGATNLNERDEAHGSSPKMDSTRMLRILKQYTVKSVLSSLVRRGEKWDGTNFARGCQLL